MSSSVLQEPYEDAANDSDGILNFSSCDDSEDEAFPQRTRNSTAQPVGAAAENEDGVDSRSLRARQRFAIPDALTEESLQNLRTIPLESISGMIASRLDSIIRMRKHCEELRARLVKPVTDDINALDVEIRRIMRHRGILRVRIPTHKIVLECVPRPPPKAMSIADANVFVHNAVKSQLADEAACEEVLQRMAQQVLEKHNAKIESYTRSNEQYKGDQLCFTNDNQGSGAERGRGRGGVRGGGGVRGRGVSARSGVTKHCMRDIVRCIAAAHRKK